MGTRQTRKTRLVGKVYNLCRVKTKYSAMLTVMRGMDPHMISRVVSDGLDGLWLVRVDISGRNCDSTLGFWIEVDGTLDEEQYGWNVGSSFKRSFT